MKITTLKTMQKRTKWRVIRLLIQDFINSLLRISKVIYKYYLNSGRRAFLTLQLYNYLYRIKQLTQKIHYERG